MPKKTGTKFMTFELNLVCMEKYETFFAERPHLNRAQLKQVIFEKGLDAMANEPLYGIITSNGSDLSISNLTRKKPLKKKVSPKKKSIPKKINNAKLKQIDLVESIQEDKKND